MGLFKADLFRALSAGFLLGALVIVACVGGQAGGNGVVPAAIAANR